MADMDSTGSGLPADADLARLDLEAGLKVLRESPQAAVVRKQINFWSVKPELQIKPDNNARIAAAATVRLHCTRQLR